jgi:glycosyltransferase involved in cell wall biosynthesis
MRNPGLAIIVPVYRQPGLLAEALDCALAQRCGFDLAIVIVDDGCPFEETRTIAAAFAMAEPRVTYLRKRNGGLSSARNFGIDFALRAWPGLEAIYFLDADNRLTPIAMANAMAVLRQYGVDWVYPSIDKFGIEWSGNYQAPYSRLAHVTFDNICEAGSLVHRRVFDAGIRFDEQMTSGYEDWEFWLQALAKGFRGRCHPSFGLEYRQRAESMLRDSNRQRASILTYIRSKHRDLWSLRNLLRWEHEEAPRFALFGDAAGDVVWFSDPERPPQRLTLDAHAEAFAAETAEPETLGTPPLSVWLPPAAEQALRQAGLFANLLWHLERLAASHDAVALHLQPDPRRIALDLDAGPQPAPPIGWACGQAALREALAAPQAGWLAAIAESAPHPRIARLLLRCRVPAEALAIGAAAPGPLATLARLRLDHDPAGRRRWIWRQPGGTPALRRYADHLAAAVGADHVMPRARPHDGRLHVGFAVPSGIEEGAGRQAAGLAAALRGVGCVTHLFVMAARECRLGDGLGAAFDSISFLAAPLPADGPHGFQGQPLALAGDLDGADKPMLGLLTELDLLVCARTPMLLPVLGQIRKAGTRIIGHLHGLEHSPLGRGSGDPYLALAFEHVFDALLVPTPALLDWLHGQGVPAAKLCLLRPSPGLALPAAEIDALLAARRSRRPTALQVLLLADAATSEAVKDRLLRLVLASRRAGLPVEWRLAGGAADDAAWWQRLAPLGIDRAAGVAALAGADLLLLPEAGDATSIWVLDAQRLGCVPVLQAGSPAAALLRDGEDGLLLAPPADPRAALALLASLAADRPRLARLSAAAAQGGAAPDPAQAIAGLCDRLAAWYPAAALARPAPE